MFLIFWEIFEKSKIFGNAGSFTGGSDAATRSEGSKLPGGKEASFPVGSFQPSDGKLMKFPVEREKVSQWEGRKLSSGKGGSCPVGMQEASRNPYFFPCLSQNGEWQAYRKQY